MAGISIANNLRNVRERLEAACRRSGRPLNSVRLLAVSKGQGLGKLNQAFEAGQTLFGENYVQEAMEKQAGLLSAEWHFIGLLQSNKVKQVVGNFALIHSVDRLKLLKTVSERAAERGIVQDILIEINIGGENSKSGASVGDAEELLRRAREWTGVRVRGLMCMPPPGSGDQSRPYFRQTKKLLEKWGTENCNELSMGTSQDFEAAIEEGATIVRIGTDIFGARGEA